MSIAESQKLRVFISYSRDDLAFADQLCAGLEAMSFAPTLDRIGISGAADWRETLKGMILKSDTVVFVLSPSSAHSEMCAEEVAIADGLAKRIIPVVCKPLEAAPVPKRLQDLNYIFFYPEAKSPGSGFGAGLGKLKVALETDMGWMREHTRYTDRASEWDTGGRLPERLLLGGDVAKAQQWMTVRPPYSPEPTPLQVSYIDASAAAERSRVVAQAQREAVERDGEIKRVRAEQEAERLKLEAATLAAERTAAQAESARRRTQMLIALPAVVVALGSIAGAVVLWSNARSEVEKRKADVERSLIQTRLLKAEADKNAAEARLQKAEAEKNAAEAQLLKKEAETRKQIADVQQSIRVAGVTARAEDINNSVPPPPIPPVLPMSSDTPLPSSPGGATLPATQARPVLKISADAVDLMAAFEIGDRTTYERRLGAPKWPGGASGVTIGIGYDIGYATPDSFANNWQKRLKPEEFERLSVAVGVKGDAANALAERVSDIRIPYSVARHHFETQSLPQYTASAMQVFPNADKLTPDQLGALVSLVYNRGTGFNGDSRLEMRNIRDAMERQDFAAVPAQFRAMKRLWKIEAILQRREAEAVLFEKGLAKQTLDQKSQKS